MTCPCNDTKRKMPGCDAGTPPVLEGHSKECPILFHTVTIPASIGDLESMPPTPGAYRNARVIYEADNVTYLYDSDGIPQLLVPDTEAIITEAVSQIPTATTTANGLMSAADKTKLDVLDGNVYSTDETVVGTWIDGKPIYRKVFSGTASSGNMTLNVGTGDVAQWVRVQAYRTTSTGTAQDTIAAFYNGASDYFRCWGRINGATATVELRNAASGYEYFAIAEYTKTTD